MIIYLKNMATCMIFLKIRVIRYEQYNEKLFTFHRYNKLIYFLKLKIKVKL